MRLSDAEGARPSRLEHLHLSARRGQLADESGSSLLFCRRYIDPAKARRLGHTRLATLMRKRAMGKFDDERAARLWAVIVNAPELAIDYEDLQRSVNLDLDLLEAEERAQQEVRERIAELYGEADPDTWLTTQPGLGDFLAAAITAFITEPGRFRKRRRGDTG